MNDGLFKTEIANHLKAVRQRKQLSLDAAAKLTGVSKAMLGQIERGESSPTIATLWKIATGLESSFSAFFAHEPALLAAEKSFPEDAKMRVKTLFPYASDSGMEMFEITLSDFHQQVSAPHGVGVIEHVHVIDGRLKVLVDATWHLLSAGETLRFYADQPHGYEADSEVAVFQNIICYPR